MYFAFLPVVFISYGIMASAFQKFPSSSSYRSRVSMTSGTISTISDSGDMISGKTITKEIMAFFTEKNDQKAEASFRRRLMSDKEVNSKLDGMHMLTILFQSARVRRSAKNVVSLDLLYEKLSTWDKEWSERDISTFVYGLRSLECVDDIDSKLIYFASKKIEESTAVLSSRY